MFLNISINVSAGNNKNYISLDKLQASFDHIIINEVELNPDGNDNSLSVEEWIELYNPTGSDIDITGWTILTTHGEPNTFTLPLGTILATNSYYIFGIGSQWLDNDDESVILRDDSGIEVDRTPTISDDTNNAQSWQRYPNGEDKWSFRASTKGATNGEDTEPPSITNVSQNPSKTSVEPDDSVTINAQIVDYVSGLNNVTLKYTKNGGNWCPIEMKNTAGNSWSATIPACAENTNVTYVIFAEDKSGNFITTEKTGYIYEYCVIPEFPSGVMLVFVVITMLFVIVTKKVSLY